MYECPGRLFWLTYFLDHFSGPPPSICKSCLIIAEIHTEVQFWLPDTSLSSDHSSDQCLGSFLAFQRPIGCLSRPFFFLPKKFKINKILPWFKAVISFKSKSMERNISYSLSAHLRQTLTTPTEEKH